MNYVEKLIDNEALDLCERWGTPYLSIKASLITIYKETMKMCCEQDTKPNAGMVINIEKLEINLK